MILTGKAKEDFRDVCEWDYYDFIRLSEVIQYALIIEWLDSVSFSEIWSLWDYSFKSKYEELKIGSSILEIQKQAIIKANEIYNKSN